jgi:hypothetical protein
MNGTSASRAFGILRRVLAYSPLAIGAIAMLSLAPLLAWDVVPTRYPPRSHDLLGALPLLAIAASYFAQQLVQKPSRLGWLRAKVVVAAFVAWAINQYWPEHLTATLWNDIAIALFVIDVFLSLTKAPGAGVAPTPSDAPESIEAEALEPDGVPVATPSDAS